MNTNLLNEIFHHNETGSEYVVNGYHAHTER